jgi:hypothetical protein
MMHGFAKIMQNEIYYVDIEGEEYKFEKKDVLVKYEGIFQSKNIIEVKIY